MRLRNAGMEDLDRIMRLEQGAFGPRRFSELTVQSLLQDPDVRTLVAEEEGAVGYGMIRLSEIYETSEILSLAVSPSLRRRGIGGLLMAGLERVSSANGNMTVMLCVRPDNREAANLYLSRGYTVLARLQSYYEDGSDADMMVKHLEDRHEG